MRDQDRACVSPDQGRRLEGKLRAHWLDWRTGHHARLRQSVLRLDVGQYHVTVIHHVFDIEPLDWKVTLAAELDRLSEELYAD